MRIHTLKSDLYGERLKYLTTYKNISVNINAYNIVLSVTLWKAPASVMSIEIKSIMIILNKAC